MSPMFSFGEITNVLTIGSSIFLIAVGAILRYAVTASVSGIDIQVVGLILMIAGAVGLVLSFFQEAIWTRRRRPEEVPAVEERREVREPPRY